MNDQQAPEERPFEGFSGGSGYDGGLQDGNYYNATLTGMKSRWTEGGIYGDGWRVIWDFAIDGTTETIDGMTSESTGENSKARPWLIALVGRQRFEERETRKIARDELVGRECMIHVTFSEKGWPRVSNVLPRQQVATPQAVQAPTPAPAPLPPPVAQGPAHQGADFSELPF